MPLLFNRLLLTMAALCSVSLIAVCMPAIFTQRDLSHPESIVPWAVHELANGRPLYSDWRQWPHRLMPYGPLLTWPVGQTFRILGVHELGFHYYLAGRIQAFLYMLAAAAAAAALIPARRYWMALLITTASIGLWPGLAIPGVSFRGDWPALFWSLAAACIAFRLPPRPRTLALSLFLFLLSVAYRPALWSFPAAYALFLLYQRKPKLAIGWGFATAATVFSYLLAGHLITDGLFILNQVGASSMGVSTEIYRLIYQMLTTPQEFPFVTWDLVIRLFLALPVAIWLILRNTSPITRGVSIYFLISLVVNLTTMAKAGASYNYMIEAYMLSTVVLSTAYINIAAPSTPGHSVPNQPLVRPAAMTIAFLLFMIPSAWFTWFNFKTMPSILAQRHMSDHQKQLMNLPPTALLGDLAFTHPSPSTHALSDPLPYARLARKDQIPSSPLVERLARREFSHIALSPGTKYLFFTPGEIPWAGEALQYHYRLNFTSEHYEIWTPAQ